MTAFYPVSVKPSHAPEGVYATPPGGLDAVLAALDGQRPAPVGDDTGSVLVIIDPAYLQDE